MKPSQCKREPSWKRYLIFINERFNPAAYGAMISLFMLSHYFIAQSAGTSVKTDKYKFLIMLAGTVVFFLKLRIYDEIKDYETDLHYKPHRPLPRGLVFLPELKSAVFICIVVELALFSLISKYALVSISVAILYSLLMYREFFIGPILRPHLTTYAVTHTFVSLLLSLSLLSAFSGAWFWKMPASMYLFGLFTWCLFNIFEFGRKTYAKEEERTGIDSYSKVFGKTGAVILVGTMAASAGLLLIKILEPPAVIFTWSCIALLILTGVIYTMTNTSFPARIYRAASSVFIIAVMAGIILFGRFF